MKSLLFFALCLLLVSCNNPSDTACNTPDTKEMKEEAVATSGCDAPSPDPAPIVTEPVPEGEVPNEAFSFDASLSFFKFEVEQEEKVHKAVDIIKQVIASQEFRTKVLTHKYDGETQFANNGGFTNAQIYQMLLDGSEKLTPGVDHEMDMELELYYTSKDTVGYTYANSKRVWMNTKFFTPYTPAQVAGNLFHEWIHKLGFVHDRSNTARRPYSVPYAIGYLIRDLGKKYE